MIVSIHQPNYLPWMGLFEKILGSDIFVFLDDAQYSNTGGHNKNVVKGMNGNAITLSVPVKQHLGDRICDVTTKDELNWKSKHLKTVEMCYKKAPYFNVVFPAFQEILMKEYKSIAELNQSIIIWMSREFGYKGEFKLSSEMNIDTAREEKVIDICCALGADCYYSGHGASAYQVEEHFNERGLELRYQNYTPIEYPQLWGEFQKNMSALDYVMNCGFELPESIRK